MLRAMLDTFWNEDVWLPPNTTWADIAPGSDKAVVYTDSNHVFYPIPLGVVFIVVRYVLEKYIFAPFGKSLGIRDARTKKAPSNPKLEATYRATPKIKDIDRFTPERRAECAAAVHNAGTLVINAEQTTTLTAPTTTFYGETTE